MGGSYYQEDISNLDQRVRNIQVRGDGDGAGRPQRCSSTGALGYENVQISSRDAVRDASGNPVIGKDGRYVTDKSAPRVLAYDVERPDLGCRRDVAAQPAHLAASAHVGRRYGSTSFGGTFAYAPDDRSSLNVSVYDNVAGFGGQLNRRAGRPARRFQGGARSGNRRSARLRVFA